MIQYIYFPLQFIELKIIWLARRYTIGKIKCNGDLVIKKGKKGTLDFSHIAPSVAYCKSKLEEVKRNKAFLHRLQDDLQPRGRLGKAEITITPHKVSLAESLTEKYISALLKNIDARFGNCLPAVSAFSAFDPVHLPQPSQPSFADYGKTEMNVIGEQFFASLPNGEREQERKRSCRQSTGSLSMIWHHGKLRFPQSASPTQSDHLKLLPQPGASRSWRRWTTSMRN